MSTSIQGGGGTPAETDAVLLPPVGTNGKAFVTGSGATMKRFMVRGIAVSSFDRVLNYNDLLSDDHYSYMEDVILPKLVELKANVIRIYDVDPSKSHRKTMNLLGRNGIYVVVGLSSKNDSIDMMKPVYDYRLFMRGIAIIHEFQAYSNTFALLTSNELVFPGTIYANDKKAAPDIERKAAAADKSFLRDMKAYMKNQGYRQIPVGMAMQDGPSDSFTPGEKADGLIGTDVVARYYAYRKSEDACADFIGINTYRYVPGGPMASYDGLAKEVEKMSVPVFLTESGAIGSPPQKRDWLIVPQMYERPLLRDNLSGQVAFQFFNKLENLGLYIQASVPQQTALAHAPYGGVDALKVQFGHARSDLPVKMPPNVGPEPAPANFNPDLQPAFTAPDTSVTFENYADVAIAVVQSGYVFGILSPGSASTPTSQVFTINKALPTELQYPRPRPNPWDLVCSVAANTLSNGSTVANNVSWGSACNVT
jgi:hypothetical protein